MRRQAVASAGLRAPALAGLALAAAAALWWLGSTRVALERGNDASRHAADALQALWLARGLVLAVWGLRLGVVHGARAAAWGAAALVAPAWPVVMLAWQASTLPTWPLLAAEAVLLLAALLLPRLGQAVGRALAGRALALPAATLLGVLLAAALWSAQGAWAAWMR